ncbi:hypothetical protein R6Q57_027115 [Mikania cordata]
MEEYKDHEDADTLSLTDLQMDEDTTGRSEEVKSTFYQDFFGFSIPNQNSVDSPGVRQPIHDDNVNRNPAAAKMEETNPMFRSNSGSFRYMRFKIGSSADPWRSRSLSVMASKSKSRWQVFMSGFGSGRFPTKMDLIDIKTRQLRSQSMTKVPQDVVDHGDGDGPKICRKKIWWRLVDVLRCGGTGGYV